jgi:hypothetical protein
MRKFAVAFTLLLATFMTLMGGVASASTASTARSAATVENVTPLALRYVCAQTLSMRGSAGGSPIPGKVLRHGETVNTIRSSGSYVLVDSRRLGRGWVIGRYLC